MTLGPQFDKMSRRAQRMQFGDPESSFGQCISCAADARRHIGGEVVRFSAPVDLSSAHENWQETVEEKEDNRKYITHDVNRVGNTIVDFTGSQFWGNNTPVPIVEHEDEYAKRFQSSGSTVDDGNEYRPGDYARNRKDR